MVLVSMIPTVTMSVMSEKSPVVPRKQLVTTHLQLRTKTAHANTPIDLYGIDYVDCDGECLSDADGDGVCNEDETESCTDAAACNYDDNPFADSDNTLCVYPIDTYGVDNVDCDGVCLNDVDGDGVCDEDEIPGCTDEGANNYSSAATDDDGSCTGCTNSIADNYYAGADIDDGTCVISGCTEAEACNYFEPANNNDGSCDYPIDLYGASNVDCDGAVLERQQTSDGTCDEDEDLDEVLGHHQRRHQAP